MQHLAAPHPHAPPAILTLVAVTHGAKVHVVLVIGEEEEAEPRVEGVDGHDEEDADDVALLIGAAVAAQVHVDLGAEQAGSAEGRLPCSGLPPLCSTGGAARPVDAASSASNSDTHESGTQLLNPEPQHPPQ